MTHIRREKDSRKWSITEPSDNIKHPTIWVIGAKTGWEKENIMVQTSKLNENYKPIKT